MKKLWLLTMLFFLKLPFGGINAKAQTVINKRITFGADGAMLKDAFQQIEKLSDVSISYNNSLLDDKRKVNVAKAERSLGETLDLLLKGTTCTYKAAGERNILIIAKTQDRGSIKGKVVDEKSEPLPGATVKVPGTGATAISGVDGSYTLNIVPGIYTVEASFISYETKRIQNVSVSSNANTVLNITLSPADNKLNEVVVTALGIKREDKSLGYSAPVIKGDQLTNALSGNWTDALSVK